MKGHFFWLSQNMKLYPELIQSAENAGFRRSSHSFTHANLPKLSEAGLTHEIDDAADVFEELVGQRPTFFRCPYGACAGNGSRIRQHIANQKMIHVAWNVDSLDWQDKNPYTIFERVKKQMEIQGRGIVLFHDIHPQSVEALKMVMAYIKNKKDWQVVTLDEAVKAETGRDYPSP
jgi:peptidoglycan/xylan/chitin deacetylase (PgdA/CDA1 family)